MTPAAQLIHAANAALFEAASDDVEAFFSPDYCAHGTEAQIHGPAGVRRFLASLRRAFPTLTVEVEILVESAERIAWQRSLRGLQAGAFQGFPALRREVVWRDMVVSRVSADRIAEEWVVTDLAAQLLLARKRS